MASYESSQGSLYSTSNRDNSDAQSRIRELQEENRKLSSQLSEVIRMNTHWQRYDAQREQHVKTVTKSLQQLEQRVGSLQHEFQEGVNIQEPVISKTNDRVEDVGASESNSAPKELRGPGSDQEYKIVMLTREINELMKRNKELEKGMGKEGNTSNDELAILREQINVCVEDFKQERRDRERIHADNEKLRERLAHAETRMMSTDDQILTYQDQIRRLREQLTSHHERRPHDTCYYPNDERPRRRQLIPHSVGQQNGHSIYQDEDFTELPRDVEIDADVAYGVDEPDGGKSDTHKMEPRRMESIERSMEPLECPRCLASFAITEHNDLLKHINKCMA